MAKFRVDISNIYVRFLLVFIGAYIVIQALGHIPSVENSYRNHYINMTDRIFKDFKGEGIVKAEPNPDESEKELDVMIMLSSKDLYRDAIRNNTNVRIARTYIFSKFLGFLPLCVFLSLIIATPLNWKQKLVALLTGLLLVQLFVIFRLWVHMMFSFNNYEWLNVVKLSGTSSSIIDFMGAIFISNPVVAYLVPLAIWILVAIVPFPRSRLTSAFNAMLGQATIQNGTLKCLLNGKAWLDLSGNHI